MTAGPAEPRLGGVRGRRAARGGCSGKSIPTALSPGGTEQETAEVRDFDGSLLEAIDIGEVDPPPLLPFRGWMAWRAGPGRREHGAPAVGPTEAGLWKCVMQELYGTGWKERLPPFVAGSQFGGAGGPSAAPPVEKSVATGAAEGPPVGGAAEFAAQPSSPASRTRGAGEVLGADGLVGRPASPASRTRGAGGAAAPREGSATGRSSEELLAVVTSPPPEGAARAGHVRQSTSDESPSRWMRAAMRLW